MKLYQIIFVLICTTQLSFSQNYKFGKVSKEELLEKQYQSDSTADAVFLYNKEHIKFEYVSGEGFLQRRRIQTRIKIYNQDGFDWATKKIRYYDYVKGGKEKIFNIKAVTYNLVNGEVKKEKISKDQIFRERLNDYLKQCSFTLPNLTEGCVIEYTYEVVSPFSAIDDVTLQYSIPVQKMDVSISTPEFFIYNNKLNPKSFYIPKIVEMKKNGQNGFNFYYNNIGIDEKNIPALKAEPFVDNINNYRAKLVMELSEIRWPDEPIEVFASNWDKVTKSIYDSESFGGQLAKSNYFEDDLNAVIGTETNPGKKAFMIYNFVKRKVKWDGFSSKFSKLGVRKAYKEGTGNIADINLMLITMLRYAGVNANPILISTKNNGIPTFPTRSGFNYVICGIEIEGAIVLLDASDINATFNTLPDKVLNWRGRLIRTNGSSTWVNLSPRSISKEVVSLNVKINSDLSVEGKVRTNLDNYIAKNYRDNYVYLSEEDHIKHLEKNKDGLEVSEIKLENKSNLLQPLKVSYDYYLEDAIEEIGGKLYFSPLLFLSTTENPFKQDTRTYPINFSYPRKQSYSVNIMLPEGYVVDHLPKTEGSVLNDDDAKYTYVIKENGKYLQLKFDVNLNTTFVLPKDYSGLKEFFKVMIDKELEKIVLKKV
ncbi:MAG: hypothetical protein BM564_08300 [Bacteroidetes bacterium MedPE-SWsnd-G2]|nr:MAG: hypothetical protein BM564_08300 [Bacteroidetes bacterium MedPE-SWsnd-G2]